MKKSETPIFAIRGERVQIKHIELKEANAFVEQHHRHHKPVIGHRFSLGAYDGEKLCGVAIVGRPVARGFDPRSVLEITRLCTDGTPNACSFLYGACARAGKALGYDRIVTYILDSEPGTSLRAAGFKLAAHTRGGSWNCPSRPREDKAPTDPKVRYEKRFFRWSEK